MFFKQIRFSYFWWNMLKWSSKAKWAIWHKNVQIKWFCATFFWTKNLSIFFISFSFNYSQYQTWYFQMRHSHWHCFKFWKKHIFLWADSSLQLKTVLVFFLLETTTATTLQQSMLCTVRSFKSTCCFLVTPGLLILAKLKSGALQPGSM